MKPMFIVSCPIDTYSGYGARARDFVKALIELEKGKIILNASEQEIKKKSFEEELLETLPRETETLEPQEKLALKNLQSRKDLIEIKTQAGRKQDLFLLGKCKQKARKS